MKFSFNNLGAGATQAPVQEDANLDFNIPKEDDTALEEGTVAEPQGMDFSSAGCLDEDAVTEAAIIQELEMMHDEERKAVLESDEFKALVEAGVVGRKTIVRLNRNDDLDRRIMLLCLQMGKEHGDADWEALRKNRIRERMLLGKLRTKYANRVRRQAVMSQKRLIKLNPRMFDMNRPVR